MPISYIIFEFSSETNLKPFSIELKIIIKKHLHKTIAT